MIDKERERMERLCKLVAIEKDPTKFDEHVEQLIRLLEGNHPRLRPEQKSPHGRPGCHAENDLRHSDDQAD